MINAFILKNGQLNQKNINCIGDLKNISPIWLDLINPTKYEKIWIKNIYKLIISNKEELNEIQDSTRYFKDKNNYIYLRNNFLFENYKKNFSVLNVKFILSNKILFSICSQDLPVFRLVRVKIKCRLNLILNYRDVLIDLYETNVEYSADFLELIYQKLELITNNVLKNNLSDHNAASFLNIIAYSEDLNSKIRRNMMDTRRAISVLIKNRIFNSNQLSNTNQILFDIESLYGHTSFLFEKINFLMDATVGFININQNKIIKIFSVASVIFLPPTLIAGIYGMNFKFIPELYWTGGYFLVIFMMISSALISFWYFYKKGWLN